MEYFESKDKIKLSPSTRIYRGIEIGPYVDVENISAIQRIKLIASKILEKNSALGQLLSIIRKLYFIVYILSSLQITAVPLVLNAYLPVNYYEISRVLAGLVFSFIPGWQEFPDEVEENLYGM